MPMWRVRTHVEDRPGRLARLAAALAAHDANILGLSVQVDGADTAGGGTVDEFVIHLPEGSGPADLLRALTAAGGRRTAVVPSSPRELVDEPTRVLLLAARLRAAPGALPEVLAELLHADEARWAHGPDSAAGPPAGPDRGELTVPVGHFRAVRLTRAGLPFTLTEAARAEALVRAVLPPGGPPPAATRITLGEGSRLTIRPMTTADLPAVRALHDRCPPDPHCARSLPADPVASRWLPDASCDPERGITLLAEGAEGSVVAMANLMYTPDPGIGEIAVLVEDVWQGHGLGEALVTRLQTLAREHGLAELQASLRDADRRMRQILTRLGATIAAGASPGIVEARLAVSGRRPPSAVPV